MGFLDIFAYVGSFFAQIASLIAEVFVILWNTLLSVFVFFYQLIQLIAIWLGQLLGVLKKFFLNLWTHYIRRGIQGLLNLYTKLRARLERIFGPLIRWLRKAREWFDKHIYPILRKYLNLIQRIRRVLVLFRIFGVGWAKALDNRLARIEGKIAQAIEIVRGTLNQVISLLALILDPSLIIRRNVFGAWLLSHLGPLKRIVGYGGNRILSAAEADALERARVRYRKQNIEEHLILLSTSGPTDEDQKLRAGFRLKLEEISDAPHPF